MHTKCNIKYFFVQSLEASEKNRCLHAVKLVELRIEWQVLEIFCTYLLCMYLHIFIRSADYQVHEVYSLEER